MGLSQAPDTELAAIAADRGQVVITADLDFPRLLAIAGATAPGLILLRGGNYNEAESLACVRRTLAVIPHDELAKCIVVVDRKRVRRRWLPV